jgi:thioredoxin-dependent peroxiredoxin
LLEVGSHIPEFELQDQDGRQVRSADLLRKGPLVLYFYPKDDTPGCTVEACGFRDAYLDFTEAGATVVGVSRDDVGSHRRFAESLKLPFTLLSDPAGGLRRTMGVAKSLGILDGRVTFVIDRQGVVRHTFRSQVQARRHVSDALEVVRRLAAS